MSELPSPEAVLDFWFGEATRSPEALKMQNTLWFNGGEKFDRELAQAFLPLLDALARGPLAQDWAARGQHGRLAAIIVLDQMSRNIFRGTPRAFAQDKLALRLCREGIELREDNHLSEAERTFFYLPLEHSEDPADQELSVSLFTAIAEDARPGFDGFAKMTLDYARQHARVIADFGRFPHRNKILGRDSTPPELDWLAAGGGF
jgi:uncharacterized protein (DUF924 family)